MLPALDLEVLASLVAMGFEESLAKVALEKSVNDMGRALDWLEGEGEKQVKSRLGCRTGLFYFLCFCV